MDRMDKVSLSRLAASKILDLIRLNIVITTTPMISVVMTVD
jgi:hypothetical protein